MSWDVILLNLPAGVRSFNELGDDFDSMLAPLEEVRRRIVSLIPEIDMTDPAWGILETDQYSIEFSIGDEDPCKSVMLHVRGTEAALEPIRSVCATTGWQAFDCSDGELINWSEDPGKGLRAWRDYRDQVMPGAPERGASLPLPDGKRVFFDVAPTSGSKPSPKPWWKFWA